jgi:hypothetical protein
LFAESENLVVYYLTKNPSPNFTIVTKIATNMPSPIVSVVCRRFDFTKLTCSNIVPLLIASLNEPAIAIERPFGPLPGCPEYGFWRNLSGDFIFAKSSLKTLRSLAFAPDQLVFDGSLRPGFLKKLTGTIR